MRFHKNGGMWFWRMGRLGGSIYVTKKPAPAREPGESKALIAGLSALNIVVWSFNIYLMVG